ncbi:MAG: M55 family metallopeptidase, partial [Thermoproteales archaeon]|nr:M55 family metallopeptidase [Thermoproteales archaeon]
MGRKIFVLGDLEGVSGVVSFDTDTSPQGKNYERSLRLATRELNALIRGLRKGGADYIIFLDGHGWGGINFELIEEDVDVLYGRP